MQHFLPYVYAPGASHANTPRSSPNANEAPDTTGSFSSGLPPRLPRRSSKPNQDGPPDAEKGLRKVPPTAAAAAAAATAGAGLNRGLTPFSIQVLLCVGLVVVLTFTLIPLVGMGGALHHQDPHSGDSSSLNAMARPPIPWSRSLAAGGNNWNSGAAGVTATPPAAAPAVATPAATHSSAAEHSGPAATASPLQLLQSADMGLQQARLWGSWKGSALQLHLWFKLMCDSSNHGGLLLRGFATAEPLRGVPFLIDHPLLPEGFAWDLPPIQILHTDTSRPPQTCINFYQEYVHRNVANVWHFQARIPPEVSSHIVGLGVPGWSSVAPFGFTPLCRNPPQLDASHATNASTTAAGKPMAPNAGAAVPAAVDGNTNNSGASSPHPHRDPHAWQTPGSIWGVVAPMEGRPLEQHAFLLLRYLRYHQQLGVNGVIQFMLSSSSTLELLRYPGIAEAVEEGSLALWLWDGVSRHNRPYYLQTHVYNAALLAGWGHDLHLLLSDLDEYLVLVQDPTLHEALQPGHCLHDVSQIRIDRFDSALDVPSCDGDLQYWMADQDPCHSILLNHLDLGPTDPWQTPWKSIVHPDEVAIYHSHNGAVLSMEALEAQAAGSPPSVVGGETGGGGATRRLQWRARPAIPRVLAADKVSTTTEAATDQPSTTAAGAANDAQQSAEAAAAVERKPQDERYMDRGCAYIMHFINLFRERRPIDGPDEKPTDRTADFTANVKACRARLGLN